MNPASSHDDRSQPNESVQPFAPHRSAKGLAMIEYGCILCLVLAVAIIPVAYFGSHVKCLYDLVDIGMWLSRGSMTQGTPGDPNSGGATGRYLISTNWDNFLKAWFDNVCTPGGGTWSTSGLG